MNQQPYCTPPRWWSPQLSPFWVRFWRPWRRQRGYRQHWLVDVDVQGAEHVEAARQAGQGVLITPNHPSHADPFVLLEASDQMRTPFYFMTAWQVFERTHRVGRRVLRQHGCFSVNREGIDLRAVRQAIGILGQSETPLVIFPEGEVFHLNDRVTHFRRGAVAAARLAARRSHREVAIVPCAIKFEFVDDPTPALSESLTRLERSLGWKSRSQLPLAVRLRRFAEALVSFLEVEYLGQAQPGELQQRIDNLIAVLMGRLEDRYQIRHPRATLPERVKQLRYRVIERLESPTADAQQRARWQEDMDELFRVMQLFSYPVDYLAGQPTVERLAETLDKLEEDVLGVARTRPRARRRAVVRFGAPLVMTPAVAELAAAEDWTEQLQQRVQGMLEELSGADLPPVSPVAAVAGASPDSIGAASLVAV